MRGVTVAEQRSNTNLVDYMFLLKATALLGLILLHTDWYTVKALKEVAEDLSQGFLHCHVT